MTVFLLSPAYCGGRRAAIALRPGSELPLARQLVDGQLDLGSAFSFFSGLYFRGKLHYARRFGTAVGLGIEPVMIITPTRGLMSPAELVTPGLIREFASVDVSEDNARYRAPLERDVATLALRLPGRARVVLLGSVASGKYVDVLWPMLGKRLCYPTSFIGRGDMSRGGLLLRCVASGEELGTLARRRSLSAPLRGVADDGRTLGGTVARHARASCDCSSRRRRGPGRHRRRCRAWWWRRRTRLVRFERAFRNRRNAEASGAYCESGENRVYSGSFVS